MSEVLDPSDQKFLEAAVKFLENPSLAIRMTNALGKPVELLHEKLPEKYKNILSNAVNSSLLKCVEVAVSSIPQSSFNEPILSRKLKISIMNKSRLHVLVASGLGAIGGFVGIVSLPIELPITTTVMLRSIAEIAKSNGEELSNPEVLLECIQVFAMGSRESKQDDALNSSYLESRIIFSRLVNKSVQFISKHSAQEVLSAIKKKAAPDIVRLISRIAAQFEIVVSEKMVAEMVPVLGAIGSAGLNGFFTDHFNKIAYYHFGIKKLERKYGIDCVQNEFKNLRSLKEHKKFQ